MDPAGLRSRRAKETPRARVRAVGMEYTRNPDDVLPGGAEPEDSVVFLTKAEEEQGQRHWKYPEPSA